MWARVLAFLVWALVAAGAVAWGLKLLASPLPLPAHAELAAPGLGAGGDWSRLFGQLAAPAAVPAPPPPPAASRFRLLGVVAAHPARPAAPGVALIAVDGKSPRALRVGAVVDGDQVLQAVTTRAVAIGPRGGEASVRLELPALPPPTSGRPGAGADSAAAALPGMAGGPGRPAPVAPTPQAPNLPAFGRTPPGLPPPAPQRLRQPPLPGLPALPALPEQGAAPAGEAGAEDLPPAPALEGRAMQR